MARASAAGAAKVAAAKAAAATKNAGGANSPSGKPTQPEAPAVQVSKSGKTVTVGCKIPTGLKLQLFRKVQWPEETRGGTIMRDRWDRYGAHVIVRGPAVPTGTAPKGYRRPAAIVGGYGITPNVDADFMREWMQQNAQNPVVVSGMIFVQNDNASAVDQSKDQRELRSGLEPIVPDNDPRIPKPVDGNVGSIETAEEFGGNFMPEGETGEMADAI